MHNLCISCLAWDRKLFSIDKYTSILCDITQSLQVLLQGKVCWECKAYLKKIQFFRDRIMQSVLLIQQYGDLNKLKQHHIAQPTLSRSKIRIVDCSSLPKAQPITLVQPTVSQPTVVQPTVSQPTVVQPTVGKPIFPPSTVVQPTVVQSTVPQSTLVQPTFVQPTVVRPTFSQPTVVQSNDQRVSKTIYYIRQPGLSSQYIINGDNCPVLIPVNQLRPLDSQSQNVNDNNFNRKIIKTEEVDLGVNIKMEQSDDETSDINGDKEEPATCESVTIKSEILDLETPALAEADCMIDCIIENPPKKDKIEKNQKTIREPEVTEVPGFWCTDLVSDAEMLKWRAQDEIESDFLKSSYKCVQCILAFKNSQTWMKHHDICHNRSIGQYVCDVCQSRFTEEHILNEHRDNHKKLYRCLKCGLTNRRGAVIIEHCKTVHSYTDDKDTPCKCVGRSKCEKCREKNKSTVQITSYNYPYKCGVCSESFVTRTDLTRHINQHHSDSTKDSQNTNQQKQEDQRAYGCGDCDKKFRFPGELLSHRLLFHRRAAFAISKSTSKR